MTFKLLLYLYSQSSYRASKHVHFNEQNIHAFPLSNFKKIGIPRISTISSIRFALCPKYLRGSLKRAHPTIWVFVVIWALGAPLGIDAPLGIGAHLGVGPSLGIGAPLGIISSPFGVSDHWTLMLFGR